MGTGSFPEVKCGRGVLLTSHPHSSAAVMEEQSYTSTHPLGHTGPLMGSIFLFRCNNGCTDAPHCHVIRTLSVFLLSEIGSKVKSIAVC